MRVKTFYDFKPERLDEKINTFLEKIFYMNGCDYKVCVKDIKFQMNQFANATCSSTNLAIGAMITYELVPVYHPTDDE